MRGLLAELAELGDFNEARLTEERVPALAAERILTLVVDLAISINSHVSVARLGESPADYKRSFTLAARAGMISDALAANLAPSASTRNALVHAYLDIDYAKIAMAIPLTLEYYAQYVRQVAAWFLAQVDEPPSG